MTSELEALRRVLDGGSSSDTSPSFLVSGEPTGGLSRKPSSPLDVVAIMKRFDATVGALGETFPGPHAEATPRVDSSSGRFKKEEDAYETPLSGAESTVERLDLAMTQAERGLDDAFGRVRDFSQKQEEAQKENDARLMRDARDASALEVDTLRDTLANTRAVLERRVCVMEDAVVGAEFEQTRLKAVVSEMEVERSHLLASLAAEAAEGRKTADQLQRAEASAIARENAAGVWVAKATEAKAVAETKVTALQSELEHTRLTCRTYESQLGSATQKLKAEETAHRETRRKLNKYRVWYRAHEDEGKLGCVTEQDVATQNRSTSREDIEGMYCIYRTPTLFDHTILTILTLYFIYLSLAAKGTSSAGRHGNFVRFVA